MPPKPFTSKELTTIADRARELARDAASGESASSMFSPSLLLDYAYATDKLGLNAAATESWVRKTKAHKGANIAQGMGTTLSGPVPRVPPKPKKK
jgi:hypothetical protein